MAARKRKTTREIKQGAPLTWRQWVRRHPWTGQGKVFKESSVRISPTEAAWLSAWFEGEGYAGVVPRIDKYGVRRFGCVIEFAQVDKEPLEWILTKFPGASFILKKNVPLKKFYWRLNISRMADVERYVRFVRPYIKTPRKLRQLEEVEEFCQKMRAAKEKARQKSLVTVG